MIEPREPANASEPHGDETVVTPRPAEIDETVVTPRPPVADETVVTPRPPVADETVVTPPPPVADETVVTPRPPVADETVVTPTPPVSDAAQRSAANPAPPLSEPAPAELPPEIAARMFKSPLDTRYRVPEAPSPAPDHALPRRGVSPALPVITSSRTGRRVAASPDTDARFGPPPESQPPPPAADRSELPSTERANRRFGLVVIAGFAASIVVAIGGLWLVAILAFG